MTDVKLTPQECVLLLRTAGLTLKDVSKLSGVEYTLIMRIAKGQTFVDYKAADSLRDLLSERKQVVAKVIQELSGVRL